MPNVYNFERFGIIQRRSLICLIVSCVILAFQLRIPNFALLWTSELVVQSERKIEAFGSTVFCLGMLYTVAFPFVWKLFLAEQMVLMNVAGIFAILATLVLYLLLPEWYMLLPMLFSLIGSVETVLLRYMVITIWIIGIANI